MKPERPAFILVLGILNIIFGTLGILLGLCGSLSAVVLLFVLPPAPQATPSPMDMFGSAAMMQAELQKVGGPLMTVFSVVQPILSLLFSGVLLASGIGLVSSTPKPWARWACIVYAVYATLCTLGGTTVQVAVVNPTIARVQGEQFRKMGPEMANNPMVGNPVLANVTSIIAAGFYLLYAFMLLIVMFLPSTATYFAGRSRPRRDEPDEENERWRD
jgi:hypothetical protein